ncbi:MAG: hypothetical protein ACK2UK_19925 [Candidatus Promineifilaceae bacterium]
MNISQEAPAKSTFRAAFLVPALILLLIIAVELVVILVVNDGHLVYTLDDTYIHMALSENIKRGHYGVNLNEVSSPSSSILWPFLLAPFMSPPIADYAPLVINIVIAFATLAVYARLVTIALCPCDDKESNIIAGLIVLLLIPMTNLVGQVFLGMEHELQTFLSALLVLGLIQEARTGHVSWWLIGAVIAGPLVRYENLALSLPALFYLVLRGHFKVALLTALAVAVSVGGFSAYLVSIGLKPLPNSVMYKTGIGVIESNFVFRPIILYARLGIKTIFSRIFMPIVFIVYMLVALSSKWPREERLLAATIAVAVLVHYLYGQIGSYHRLEMYVWLSACLMLIYLFRANLRRLVQNQPLYRSAIIIIFFGLLLAREYTTTLFTTPLASNNIYQQQYQMHRFTTEFLKDSVAVNDLGWVAYDNDDYVLDLMGLASYQALWHRFNTVDPSWMNDLAAEHGVHVAMIYDFRFRELPPNWRRLGELRLGRLRLVPAGDTVSFYALDEETAKQIQPALSAFQQSLPPGVIFEMTGE